MPGHSSTTRQATLCIILCGTPCPRSAILGQETACPRHPIDLYVYILGVDPSTLGEPHLCIGRFEVKLLYRLS